MTRQDRSRPFGAVLVTLLLVGGAVLTITSGAMADMPVDVPGPGPRAIIKTPYLQNVTRDSITICWETDTAGSSDIDYGPTAAYGSTVNGQGGVTFHEVTITGLEDNTTYHYKVSTDGASSEDATFRTAVAPHGSFTFAALGDTRTNHTAHSGVMQQLDAHGPGFVLNSGDIVATGGSQAEWDAFFVDTDGVLNHTPYYPAVGNHDLPGALYMKYFSLPNNERYYSFDHGSVHFTVLDTNLPYTSGTAQQTWLLNDLENANASSDWKFVLFHHPAFSSSSHGSDPNVQAHLVPIMEQYRVDAVFNGHDHDYEHALVNGVHYFVTGGGGAPLYANGTSSWTVHSESAYHFMLIDVTETRTNLKAIRMDGTLMEELNLSKPDVTPPDPVPLTATDAGLSGTVDINWSGYDEAVQRDVAGYRLYWSTTDFTKVDAMTPAQTFPPGTFNTSVTGLVNDVEHFFAITAFDEVPNEDLNVTTASAIPTDKVPPLPPVGLALLEAGHTYLNITWDPNSEPDLAGYHVLMNQTGAGSGGPYDLIASLDKGNVTYNVTGLTDNTSYCLALLAFDNATIPNNSSLSAEACFDTLALPVNRPPVAVDHVLTFLEDTDLWNDRAVQLDLVFTDQDDDALTYEVVWSDIGHRLQDMSGEDTLIIDPPANWSGTAHVNVSATDGEFTVHSNITVNVIEVNDPPLLLVPQTWTVLQDQNGTLVVERSDAEDPEDELVVDSDIARVVSGAILGENVWIDAFAGNVTLLANNDMVGEYDIHVTVTDRQGLSTQATVHLLVEDVNDPPSIRSLSPEDGSTYKVNTTIDFEVVATDPDLRHGDRLSYVWSTDITGPFGYGAQVSYRLPIGVYNVTVTVNDIGGYEAEGSLKIVVENDTDVPPPPPPEPPPPDTPDGPNPLWGWLLMPCIVGIVIILVILVVIIMLIRGSGTGRRVGPAPPPYGYPPPGYPAYPGHPGLHGHPQPPGPVHEPTTVGPSGLPPGPEGAAQAKDKVTDDDDWEVVPVEETELVEQEDEGAEEDHDDSDDIRKDQDLDSLISRLKQDQDKDKR